MRDDGDIEKEALLTEEQVVQSTGHRSHWIWSSASELLIQHRRLLKWICAAVILAVLPWSLLVYQILRQPVPTTYTALTLDDVAISIKTGANEIHQKLPIHLELEFNRHIPNFQIYSDWSENLIVNGRNYTVIDILDGVKDFYKDHPNFKPYFNQLERLKAAAGAPGTYNDLWHMDAYKFVPLQGDMYKRFPDAKFTINIEADTFLFLDNLMRWLATVNPKGFAMYGKAIPGTGGIWFAHGGSGYVLSRGLLDATYGRDFEGTLHRTDQTVRTSCCGDEVLALNMFAPRPGVDLKMPDASAWLYFFGETPVDLPVWDDTYCLPVFSMHHVDVNWTKALHNFERQIWPRIPADDYLRRSDVFEHFLPSFLASTENGEIIETHWSNSPQIIRDFNYIYSEPETQDTSYSTTDDCSQACEDDTGCFMWEFSSEAGKSKCHLGNIIRIGKAKANVTSGWKMDRIHKFRQRHKCYNRL